mgnify:CR=1 FL=1
MTTRNKSTKTKPSLLTFDEVETIFHEFGHCLHGLLSKVKYKTIGGTSVYWDFVELPSQIMENWVGEKEALSLFAHHYETGELIPDDLLQKIKDSKNFMSGTMCLRQLSIAYLDMAWFGRDNDVDNVEEFETKATEKTRLLEKIPGSVISPTFGHIFSGGYSAGYYSYIWAEVLDADSVEWFKENGGLRRENGDHFRSTLLSRGGSRAAMDLFREFRGAEPNVQPLLVRRGLD